MKKRIGFGMAVFIVAGCELATTDTAVTQQEVTFATNLIRDEGFRCQSISSIKRKANVEGWSVACFAQAYDTEETEWTYEITKLPRGWTISPWKINSELPARCQKTPQKACPAP